MDIPTFKQSLIIASEWGELVSVGGGEPTVHPNFYEIIARAIGYSQPGEPVWIATNGKKTEEVMFLATLGEKGVLSVALSADNFHENISQHVLDRFALGKKKHLLEIREIIAPLPAGRAKRLLGLKGDSCPCDDLFVSPNGKLWWCGHKRKSLGTVWKPDEKGLEEYFELRSVDGASCSRWIDWKKRRENKGDV